MSESIRRVRLVFLLIEMLMMLGAPMPNVFMRTIERARTRRWERRRTRSLPKSVQALERLLRNNPGLTETWNRSTHIRRKADFSA